MADEPKDYWGWVAEGRFDHEWKIYDAHLKPEHTFIDLGAWVGSHSLYASTIVKKIVAVEPDPVAHKILSSNIWKSKRCPDAFVGWQAIASDSRMVTLGSGMLGASTTRKNLAAGGGIGAAEETFEIGTESLRSFSQMFRDPLFIKMDIEGMEEEVFKDWTFFHERQPALFVELHPWWWEDEAKTRSDFQKVQDAYKTVKEVRSGLYFLEN